VALSALTDSPVIGVFHTLSAGKAGQWVPGSVVPATFGVTVDADDVGTGVAPALSTNAIDEDIVRAHATTRAFNRRHFVRCVVIAILRFLPSAPRGVAREGIAVGEGPERHWTAAFYDGGVEPRKPLVGTDDAQLRRDFFERPSDVVAKDLLGTFMIVRGTRVLRARILETEAYGGLNDPASHAFRGPTPRAAIMFGPAGFLYVYLSYGIHWCMNIVTGLEGTGSAVLFRAADAVDITDGDESPTLPLRGPGNLTRGLEITGADNGIDCCSASSHRFSFHAAPTSVDPRLIGQSPRIGLSREKERRSRYFLRPEIPK
jgi:DNA-3-methyladenine glycosylase